MNNKRELCGIIMSFSTGEAHEMTVCCNGSYSVNEDVNSLYNSLRYYNKKLRQNVRVSREYNTIKLIKTV